MFEEIEVSTGDLTLAGRAFGPRDGRPVLALHGWLDNAATFDRVAPWLVDAGLRVVSLDQAGHGRSDRRPGQRPYLFVEYIADVVLAADSLEWETFSLLGHSMGAGVASLVAGTVPDRIERCALIEGLGPWSNPPDKVPLYLASALARVGKYRGHVPRIYTRDEATERFRHARNGLTEAGARPLLNRGVISVGASELDDVDVEDDEASYVRFAHDPLLRAPSWIRFGEDQILAFLERISCPTRLLIAEDGWPSEADARARRYAAVDGLDRIEVPGCHHVHLDDPERIGPLLADFLAA